MYQLSMRELAVAPLIDALSTFAHQKSSQYLGISLFNLAYPFTSLYSHYHTVLLYTLWDCCQAPFCKCCSQGVTERCFSLIFTLCVWVIRFDRLRVLNTTTLCLFTPFIYLSAHMVYSRYSSLSCHRLALIRL